MSPSIFPIYGEGRDQFGSPIPAMILYVGDATQAPITFINAAVAQTLTRDYAKELLDRVRYLKKTYATPYGPNSVAPTAQAFNDAEEFIRKLPLNKTGLPAINIASDGEVNFDWSTDVAQIDLGFFGDGTYSYYARGGNLGEHTGESIQVQIDIPHEIIKIASVSAG